MTERLSTLDKRILQLLYIDYSIDGIPTHRITKNLHFSSQAIYKRFELLEKRGLITRNKKQTIQKIKFAKQKNKTIRCSVQQHIKLTSKGLLIAKRVTVELAYARQK